MGLNQLQCSRRALLQNASVRVFCRRLGSAPRFNSFGVQMLPNEMHRAVFSDAEAKAAKANVDGRNGPVIQVAKKHLGKHKIPFDQPSRQKASEIKHPQMPKGLGGLIESSSLEEHFFKIRRVPGWSLQRPPGRL